MKKAGLPPPPPPLPPPVKVGISNIGADGKIEMKFNQKLEVPEFIKNAKKKHQAKSRML